MAKRETIISKHFTVAGAAIGGTEVAGLLGGQHRGVVDQVIARASAGGGTDIDIQIRLISGDSDVENLVYSTATAAYPLIDSSLNAPFDTFEPTSDDDLILYVEPQADGTIQVRIDFRIFE